MEELNSLLEKKTKTELIDLICSFVSNGELSMQSLQDSVMENGLTEQEIEIINKVKRQETLTTTELEYINKRLDKRKHSKVNSLIKGSNKFDSFLVSTKLDGFFNLAWKKYPKKVGKELGKKSFVKLIADKRLEELTPYCSYVIKRIEKYTQYCIDHDTEEQYILHFSTFCNSKKYL